jgi:excisionase family DNA binding protein
VQSTSTSVLQWQSLKDDPLLRVSEIADTLDVSHDTVKRWIAAGKLVSIKLCGVHRVRRSRVLALLGNEREAMNGETR